MNHFSYVYGRLTLEYNTYKARSFCATAHIDPSRFLLPRQRHHHVSYFLVTTPTFNI
jgi:hypothetical protein